MEELRKTTKKFHSGQPASDLKFEVGNCRIRS